MGRKICSNSAFTSRLRKNLNIRNTHAVRIRSGLLGRAGRSPFGLAGFSGSGIGIGLSFFSPIGLETNRAARFGLEKMLTPGRDLKYKVMKS